MLKAAISGVVFKQRRFYILSKFLLQNRLIRSIHAPALKPYCVLSADVFSQACRKVPLPIEQFNYLQLCLISCVVWSTTNEGMRMSLNL